MLLEQNRGKGRYFSVGRDQECTLSQKLQIVLTGEADRCIYKQYEIRSAGEISLAILEK